ncbi:MAG: hypothetical protein EZS28_010775 [Streblomastix strix]|uniref:Uncharacterized protein n=1 Tax=Streblomastix strix TaxID=222440 RepID=A0A5J4WFP3_9EUKA|nr:MAG: hypothetical protein EZS28_010775 [Streblomastix strix]
MGSYIPVLNFLAQNRSLVGVNIIMDQVWTQIWNRQWKWILLKLNLQTMKVLSFQHPPQLEMASQHAGGETANVFSAQLANTRSINLRKEMDDELLTAPNSPPTAQTDVGLEALTGRATTRDSSLENKPQSNYNNRVKTL